MRGRERGRWTVRVPLGALIAIAGAALLASSAQAAEIDVTALTDSGGSGCELREAIASAESGTSVGGCTSGELGPDTIIIFAAGAITLTSGPVQLAVSSPITIIGLPSTTISPGVISRVFHVQSIGDLSLTDLTVSGGQLSADGGGILNEGGLHLDGVTLTGNHAIGEEGGGIFGAVNSSTTITNSQIGPDNLAGAPGGDGDGSGGGIFVEGGTLTVDQSTIHGNSALNTSGFLNVGSGGGIAAGPFGLTAPSVTITNSQIGRPGDGNLAKFNGGGVAVPQNGSLHISGSLFVDNQAQGITAGGGSGGAVFLVDTAPTTNAHRIVDSVITGNQAPGGGGLFSSLGSPQTIGIIGSTFSGNGAVAGGGALFFGPASILNSTFSGNVATNNGAALTTFTTTPPVVTSLAIRHTTIAGNQAPGGSGSIDFNGDNLTLESTVIAPGTGDGCAPSGPPITSGGYNVVSDATCALGGTGDLQSTNPLIGGLADNGGPHAGVSPGVPVETRALLAGSLAIDRAPCMGLTVDQRGFPRPSPSGGLCDSGSFELTQAGAAPTAGLPSNAFSFGKVKRNKKKGIAFLFVNLPGPGEVGLRGKGLKTIGGAGVARESVTVSGGTVKLKVAPGKQGKAARRIRAAMLLRGKAQVTPQVTYLPTGGVANTQSLKIKLIRRPSG